MRKSRKRDNIHETPDVSYIQNPDVDHERSDVNVRAVLMFVVGLLVFAIIVHVLMWWLLDFFEASEARKERQPGPMAITAEKERLPPEPRLQAAPGFGVDGQDLSLQAPQSEYLVVRKLWDEALKNGAVDEHGVRTAIPIEDAKKMLLNENALKSRPQAGGQETLEQVEEMPSYSSSGRMMERRMQ
jgi:hypothetical protein